MRLGCGWGAIISLFRLEKITPLTEARGKNQIVGNEYGYLHYSIGKTMEKAIVLNMPPGAVATILGKIISFDWPYETYSSTPEKKVTINLFPNGIEEQLGVYYVGYRCLEEDPDFEYLRFEIYPYGQNQSKLFMFSFLSRKMANNILLEIKNNCGDLFLSKEDDSKSMVVEKSPKEILKTENDNILERLNELRLRRDNEEKQLNEVRKLRSSIEKQMSPRALRLYYENLDGKPTEEDIENFYNENNPEFELIDNMFDLWLSSRMIIATMEKLTGQIHELEELNDREQSEEFPPKKTSKRKIKKPGRPHLPDDIWAWKQIYDEGREPTEVYNEWLSRDGVKERHLIDPVRQFKRIDNPDWQK